MIFSDLVSCLKDFSHPDVIYISSGIIFHWEIFSKKKEKGKSNLTQGQISRIELSEKSSFSVVKKDVETALRLLVSTASEYMPGSHGRSLLTVLTPSLKKPCECIPCVTPIRKLDHLDSTGIPWQRWFKTIFWFESDFWESQEGSAEVSLCSIKHIERNKSQTALIYPEIHRWHQWIAMSSSSQVGTESNLMKRLSVLKRENKAVRWGYPDLHWFLINVGQQRVLPDAKKKPLYW